jgi:hypothetical protein
LANYTRDNTPYTITGYPVYIASSTSSHISDLEHCLDILAPKIIFIEKGFKNNEQKRKAKELVNKKKIPTYILSQYRFSTVLEYFKLTAEYPTSISYRWSIDKGEASEWGHHINSIDKYIKNTANDFYIEDWESCTIDKISSYDIHKGVSRRLYIDIETDKNNITISLGKTNSILIKSKDGKFIGDLHYNDEDCLDKQITEIINKSYKKLERL